MKTLITGAAGFIGSHTAERLALLGHEVVAVDNFSDYYSKALKLENEAALKSRGIAVIHADLKDPSNYRRLPQDYDYVFHFATHPGISKSSTFEDYLSNNIVATRYLTEFAERCTHLKFFVNIGTSSIYGSNATKDEGSVPAPISYYGITKLAAEQLVLSQSRNASFKACSLRLYSVFGPRERPDKLYSKLIDCAYTKNPFPLYEGSLEHSRSFTYVDDIVDGLVAVIGKEDRLDGEIINLGCDQEYTTQHGIQIVEELLGTHIKFTASPPRYGDQERTKAVIGKAKKLLGYQPHTTLREGLQRQIEWYGNLNKLHFA